MQAEANGIQNLTTISIDNINVAVVTTLANSKSANKSYKNALKAYKISGSATQSQLHMLIMCSYCAYL